MSRDRRDRLYRVTIALTISTSSVVAQNWALGVQGGTQTSIERYEFLNNAAYGALNFQGGLLVQWRPDHAIRNTPISYHAGLLVGTRRLRVVTDAPPNGPFDIVYGAHPYALTPEINIGADARVLTFGLGKLEGGDGGVRTSRLSFDAGLGLGFEQMTGAEVCYRTDDTPCNRENAHVYGFASGGSPVALYLHPDLYWDSDLLWPKFRMRAGIAGNLYPKSPGRYTMVINYAGENLSERGRVNMTAGRVYAVWVLPKG